MYVPCFQIDKLTLYIKLYIPLHFINKLLKSMLLSAIFNLLSMLTFMIFHNITSFLSYVTTLVKQFHSSLILIHLIIILWSIYSLFSVYQLRSGNITKWANL